MESAMSDFINNSSNNINSTLATSVGTMVKAASDIKANATVAVQQLVKEIHLLKDQLKVLTIYFRARITNSKTYLSYNQDVVFPSVEVNEGQVYDSSTGKSTASVSGMYQFSAQYCVYGTTYAYLEIVHQGKTLQRSSHSDYPAGGFANYPCVTMQVSSSVAMGHQVWVRSTGSTTLYADSQRYTSFSGTLIHL
ncbi:uncharacterized protein LOC127838689 [Dreissena polymorpha]|uniref:C1q domain-containing protein n=1 Tax=Dreissena polymorpha TaxID=45954 RepID=A0A9D4J552_DREPO|nr:uncharacterized protein LOC127838689 [Dreissena polymorpha]KAH3798815.1 hypothetical protein DPMN_152418 [Dreissena polymorpha]